MLLKRCGDLARANGVNQSHNGMANLAGCCCSSVVELPIKHQATAHTTAQMEIKKMLAIAANTKCRLGERDQVCIVINESHSIKGILNSFFQWKLLPPGHPV